MKAEQTSNSNNLNEHDDLRSKLVYGDVRRDLSNSCAAIKSLGLISEPFAKHPLIEYYRKLNSEILTYCNSRPDGVKGVIVTSQKEKEGRSSVAINLAISLSLQDDVTPILVDLSGNNTGINNVFSLKDNLGIMDYLVNPNVSLESMLVTGPAPQIKILPYGTENDRRFELLTHEKMQQVLCSLEGMFSNSILIIDGPTLAKDTEISMLLPWIKGYVLVVRAGDSLQSDVRNGLKKLGTKQGIGVVFNQDSSNTTRV
jgi:protein-tyrosine kinase